MISPHTKQGTKIVCINNKPLFGDVRPLGVITSNMDGLQYGEIYTVHTIKPFKFARSGYIVTLCEIKRPKSEHNGYDLGRFEYLIKSLPECITSILTNVPKELEFI